MGTDDHALSSAESAAPTTWNQSVRNMRAAVERCGQKHNGRQRKCQRKCWTRVRGCDIMPGIAMWNSNGDIIGQIVEVADPGDMHVTGRIDGNSRVRLRSS